MDCQNSAYSNMRRPGEVIVACNFPAVSSVDKAHRDRLFPSRSNLWRIANDCKYGFRQPSRPHGLFEVRQGVYTAS